MLEKLKGLTKDSLIYGVGHIATRMLTFLLLPYYSHHLSPAEYGEVTLYFIFVGVVQTFYLYGMDIAFLRYYNLTTDRRERGEITGTTVVTSLWTSAGFTLLIFVGAGVIGPLVVFEPVHPETLPTMIRLCAGILFFDTISTFPYLILRGERKPVRFIGVKTFNVAVNLGLNIYLVGARDMSVAGILWANLIASAVTTVIMWPDISRIWIVRVDWRRFREMIAFGLPNIPTFLFVMVTEAAGRKILEVNNGLGEAGLYSAGYKLGMFMAVVTAAFRFAWQPFFLSHAKDEDAPRLFARVMTYYLLVTCALFLFLTYFTGPVLYTQWPGLGYLIAPEFWAGLSVFPIILLAHIFDGVYANLMPGVYINKLTRRLPLVTGAAAALNIGGNLLLIPVYGMLGAAWVTVASFVLQAVLLWLVVRRAYAVPYEWPRLLKLALVTGILAGLAFAPGLGTVGPRVILLLCYIPLLLALRFFDERELSAARRLVGRK
ncbi:polysaccharide biosynthesis C-terminal domain-containing protein [candidate division KSB1 bacterium]|nr:polysaccharide biosynthesis C-terminal domain-containing protein [candidate division KSB1 bacterium]